MGALSLVHILLAVNVSLAVVLLIIAFWLLLNVRTKAWASRNDDVPVLAVELLAPEETGAVLLGALVNDGVRILSDCLNLDRLFLRVLCLC